MKRLNSSRIIALILINLIPIALIVFGIILFIKNMLINFSFLLSFLILPCLFSLISFILITSSIKNYWKIILNILLVLVLFFAFLTSLFFGTFEALDSYENDQAIVEYSKYSSTNEIMPKLDAIIEPDTLEYYIYELHCSIFTSQTDVLICKYDELDYSTQKSLLHGQYTFQSTPMISHIHSCEPYVEIDGYEFRFLSYEGAYDNILSYPKRVVMIATNDYTHEIIYMYYHDADLDCIESMEDFINNDCGWKHIH